MATMHRTSHFIITALLIVLMAVQSVAAQTTADVWRSFAERVDVGTELNVRLNDGRRMRATLVGVRADAVLLQPNTRIPVSIQAVPYNAIVRMEPRKAGHSAGKAVAIGVAAGVGAFFGIMLLIVAAVAD
jgi:uncharacterized protein (DUF2062 family)